MGQIREVLIFIFPLLLTRGGYETNTWGFRFYISTIMYYVTTILEQIKTGVCPLMSFLS